MYINVVSLVAVFTHEGYKWVAILLPELPYWFAVRANRCCLGLSNPVVLGLLFL